MSTTPPFMQLYVGDYLADTLHLTTEQHGAYLLLLMTMWRAGASLPNDAAKLARICRVSPKRWPSVWAEIEGFFETDGDTISNYRLSKEHLKAVSFSQERKTAGKKGAEAKALKRKDAGQAELEAELKHGQKSDIRTIKEEGGGGSACEREADPASEPDRVQILAAIGVGPDGVTGPSRFIGGQGDMAEARRWLELPGLTLPIILDELRRITAGKADGAPGSFRYFTTAMQRLSGQLTAEPLHPITISPSEAPHDQRYDRTHRRPAADRSAHRPDAALEQIARLAGLSPASGHGGA